MVRDLDASPEYNQTSVTVRWPLLSQVPVYSIQSWLALRFKEQGIYLETAREWCGVTCGWQSVGV
jgi:hypothetical protein